MTLSTAHGNKKITPHLWFATEAKDAANFYVSAFREGSAVTNITTIPNTPSGDCDSVSFTLCGQPFMALGAGPLFTMNPSISFQVKCKTIAEADLLWGKFSDGGEVLMEYGKYHWSERYGWVKDAYGLSWQIMYVGEQPFLQKITPCLMFVGSVCGKAEESVRLYTSVFNNSHVGTILRYAQKDAPNKEGTVQYAAFTLDGVEYVAMDSAHGHNFAFNEAISFIVYCDTQDEIDYYWGKLSAVKEAEQCGWLKDTFGVSWQIVPRAMAAILASGDEAKIARVTEAFLTMKKLDIEKLASAAREDV